MSHSAPHRNRLAGASSPYLLQHAGNPVDWYPWGPEAFEKARAENKLIFLSIGYSTCHWCHVMERESFENPETARLLNAHFVNIKVDREERPDIDRAHMLFVQATTGSGGWPMSVWLTPELEPVVGGTYFPPHSAHGRPGFPEVILRIAEAWREDAEGLRRRGAELLEALASHAAPGRAGGRDPFPGDAARNGFLQLRRAFDAELGGFGRAPKFPHPVAPRFLLRYADAVGRETSEGREALAMVTLTLRRMAEGGMYDQVAGGFHRYSVDRFWHVPHFEKMLYDQAQLALLYLEASQASGDRRFESVARDTLDYVVRDLADPGGGFHSAEDADSYPEAGAAERREGAFAVWTKAEVESVLSPADAEIWCAVFGIDPGGNAPEGSDPHGEFGGRNIPIRRLGDAEAAARFGLPEAEIREVLTRCRGQLRAARAARPLPHRDDKVLAAWNGLMVSALVRCGVALGEPAYLAAGLRALGFVRERMWDPGSGVLLRSWRNDVPGGPGFAEDYACVIAAALDAYEATGEGAWFLWAERLQERMEALFAVPGGAYYGSSGEDPSLRIRMVEDHDGAEPAASSVAAHNLLRFARLLDDPVRRNRAEEVIGAFGSTAGNVPTGMPWLLAAWLDQSREPVRVVLCGSEAERAAFASAIGTHYLPGAVVIHAVPGDPIVERSGFLRSLVEAQKGCSAFVCRGTECRLPVHSAEALAGELGCG